MKNRREFETWAIDELKADGWLTERAVLRATYIGAGKLVARPHDFFGCFDLIAVNGHHVRFIQVTSIDYTTPGTRGRGGWQDPTATIRKHQGEIDTAFPAGPTVEIWVYYKQGSTWSRKARRIYRRVAKETWKAVEAQATLYTFRNKMNVEVLVNGTGAVEK